MESIGRGENLNQPLLGGDGDQANKSLASRVWIESKKLWHILGPYIFFRLSTFSLNIITQAFAGHLGDVELAAISISVTVILGFSYGLLLGMASALETLCGQAFGAKRYDLLGIYLQRSWIVLFLCCFLLLPMYIFAAPILKYLGQPDDVAELSGILAIWLIPILFSSAFYLPINKFLLSQQKTRVLTVVPLVALAVNLMTNWLFVYVFDFGVVGAAVALDISWWVLTSVLFGYVVLGWCPFTWSGFSIQALSGLWEFVKLSAGSGVMLCLENWYYRILLLMTGNLEDTTTAFDALSVCMNINGWEVTIPFCFLAATGVRVANELGAGNGKAAKFATKVSLVQSTIIGLFFGAVILILREKIALIFTSAPDVLQEVDKLSSLLAITVLFNSVQPVLSGVAVGSGWQATIAYINLGCYYVIGLPLGCVMGWVFNWGVMGVWAGMIFGGTAVQTIMLVIITVLNDWEKEAEVARKRVQRWSNDTEDSNQSKDQAF
ncbi:Protein DETOXIFICATION [Melia azedarach]|uniref:Protein DETOXIFICATION n=1 Tax=Melia azedarach TaxID=155640 RepID=A0ACC1WRB9_MELAZ|nr:Protein DETOXIFICATION [Melia azedarach]